MLALLLCTMLCPVFKLIEDETKRTRLSGAIEVGVGVEINCPSVVDGDGYCLDNVDWLNGSE